VVLFVFSSALLGCNEKDKARAVEMTGGDFHRGKMYIAHHGCSSCHTIPGIREADGVVGPSLSRIGVRPYIGGVARNTPDNMIRWIQNAPGVDPQTAMPNLHVPESDARDIASYLYTLR
jgi:cytochrome c